MVGAAGLATTIPPPGAVAGVGPSIVAVPHGIALGSGDAALRSECASASDNDDPIDPVVGKILCRS
jgi:hypothetical protein